MYITSVALLATVATYSSYASAIIYVQHHSITMNSSYEIMRFLTIFIRNKVQRTFTETLTINALVKFIASLLLSTLILHVHTCIIKCSYVKST